MTSLNFEFVILKRLHKCEISMLFEKENVKTPHNINWLYKRFITGHDESDAFLGNHVLENFLIHVHCCCVAPTCFLIIISFPSFDLYSSKVRSRGFINYNFELS